MEHCQNGFNQCCNQNEMTIEYCLTSVSLLTKGPTMRYDDRVTCVELSAQYENEQALFALLNEQDAQAEDAQADADQSRESYECESEYDDREWCDKNNY